MVAERNRIMNMTSTTIIQNQLKFQLFQTQYGVLAKTNEVRRHLCSHGKTVKWEGVRFLFKFEYLRRIQLQDDHAEWFVTLSFVARMVVYVAILALFVIVVSLILKYLGDCDVEEATREQVTATETNRLLPKKAIPFTYGTCEEDLESGKCSSSSSESSDDLYDGKLCIFCYDEQRNCFFVPCGHCASCYVCAQRIIEGENKTCPVCRRYIHKVRKLFTSQNETSR